VVWLRNPGRTLIYEDNRAMELKEKLRSSKAKYRLEETPKTVLLAHNSYILLVVYLILCPESLPLQMMNWDIKIEAPTKWQRREVDPRTTMELLRRRKMKMKTPKVHSRSLIVTSPCHSMRLFVWKALLIVRMNIDNIFALLAVITYHINTLMQKYVIQK